MNGLDTTAGIILGAYLIAVAVNGNSGLLLTYAQRDKAFLAWAVAVGVIYYLHTIPELKGPVSILIAMAFVGFGINAGVKFQDNIKNIWATIAKKEA